MLVFFLKSAKLDPKGFNLIFYTGSEVLPDTIENYNGNVNLTIIRERPNVQHIIPNIIQDIDKHGHSQSEAALPDPEMVALAMLQAENKRLLENANQNAASDDNGRDTAMLRVSKLAEYAEDKLGYNLTQLVNAIPNLPTIDDDGGNGDIEDPNTVARMLLERIEEIDLNADEILADFDPTHSHVKPDEYIHNGHSVWSTDQSERSRLSRRNDPLRHEHEPLLEEEDDIESGFEEKLEPPRLLSTSPCAKSIPADGMLSNSLRSRRGIDMYASRLAVEQDHDHDDGKEQVDAQPIWKERKSARPYIQSMPAKNLETWVSKEPILLNKTTIMRFGVTVMTLICSHEVSTLLSPGFLLLRWEEPAASRIAK